MDLLQQRVGHRSAVLGLRVLFGLHIEIGGGIEGLRAQCKRVAQASSASSEESTLEPSP